MKGKGSYKWNRDGVFCEVRFLRESSVINKCNIKINKIYWLVIFIKNI